jgi:hypothetical protein
MRRERGGSARRIASFVALGCLMGAATVGGTIFASRTPALASCSSIHANVQAKDASSNHYGNRAHIYVNTSTVINNLRDALFRSLAVRGSLGNDVEVGWTANNGGHSGPTVFAEWVNRGADSGPKFYTGYSLSTNTDTTFIVENVGHIGIFRFYVDGQSSAFNFSPTMNFNSGLLITNSEHYNTCDSLWTHMYNINYFDANGNWSSSYGNLQCRKNTSTGWYLHKDSNSELHVNQTSSGALC